MQLFYNEVALHALGTLRLGGERSELIGPPDGAPHRRRVLLTVRLDLFSETADWAGLRTRLEQVRTALAVPRARLQWVDESGPKIVLDQDATLVGHDLPDDPNGNASGPTSTRHQAVVLTFAYEDHAFAPGDLGLVYTPSGGAAVTLGHPFLFRDRYGADRYSPFRDPRSRAAGQVTASGQLLADPTAPLATRRANLLAQVALLRTARNSKAGTLVYSGDTPTATAFSQAVRISDLTFEINSASTAIDWSLAAEYTLFPDESGYAMADYQVRTRTEQATGRQTVSLAGRIAANTLVAAQTKLAVLRTAHVSGLTRLGEPETAESRVDGVDGATFIELSFDEQYRATSGTALEWSLRLRSGADVRSGFVRHTWSGSVLASGATWDAAYQVAAAKAAALGGAKQQFLLSSELSVNDDQQSGDRLGSGAVQVRLEFSYEYQLRGTRKFLEVTGEVAKDSFGPNRERVSGVIVCATRTAAGALLAELQAAYAGRVLEGQRVSESGQHLENASGPAVGSAKTPAGAGSWGTNINTGEAASTLLAGFTAQFVRLDFSFEVFLEKTTSEIAVRYALRTQVNRVTLEKVSRLTGTVAAPTRALAEDAVEHIAAGYSLGSRVTEDRGEDRQKFLGSLATAADDAPAEADPAEESYGGVLVNFSFDDEYRTSVAGPGTVIQCEVAQEIQFSGTRWNVQPTAYGRDVLQACGIASGRRVVRGSVTAATEALCIAWARRQYHLPFPGSGFAAAPGTRYRLPPRFVPQPAFVPLTDGVVSAVVDAGYNPAAAAPNVQVWRLEFSFEEVLPEHDYVAAEP